MKQREAVYKAVTDVISFEDGDDVNESITKEQRGEIHEAVMAGFKAGEVDFSENAKAKYNTDPKLSGYVSGLISNWLRKDLRMNGNSKYVAKNPGSRAGQGDGQIRELRKLLKIHSGGPKEAEIQRYIDTRLTTLQAEKTKNVEIDYSQLPAELQDLAPSTDDEE